MKQQNIMRRIEQNYEVDKLHASWAKFYDELSNHAVDEFLPFFSFRGVIIDIWEITTQSI